MRCEGWGATPLRGSSISLRLWAGRPEWSGCTDPRSSSQTAGENSAPPPPWGCSSHFQKRRRGRWKTHTPALFPLRPAGPRRPHLLSAPRTRTRRSATLWTTEKECYSPIVSNWTLPLSHLTLSLLLAGEPLQTAKKTRNREKVDNWRLATEHKKPSRRQ